jgi:hypothetical protein
MKLLHHQVRIYVVLVVSLLFFSQSNDAGQICEISIKGCPEDINGKTLYVPPEVIAISSSIHTCEFDTIRESIDKDAPAIMFVIDNSISMKGWNDGSRDVSNDLLGARFTVTRSLVDTFYNAYQETKIGVTAFVYSLYFYKPDHPLFVNMGTMVDTLRNQSYMPLLKLNEKVRDDSTGRDILKALLQTHVITNDSNGGFANKTVDLIYQPPKRQIEQGTNITNAFDAAKKAFENCGVPKDRQFIIFLSDGEPTPDPDNDHLRFERGENTPTTFTVFFNSRSSTIPQSIVRMSNNIKRNGYSSSNPLSEVFVLNANHDALMKLISEKIMTKILDVRTGSPHLVKVNELQSETRVGDNFVFTKRFPLNDKETDINLDILYKLTSSVTSATQDTLIKTQFKVVRQNGELSSELIKNCWNQGVITFYYNGQPITAINESMKDSIEIRFNPGSEKYVGVPMVLSQTAGSSHDKDTIFLKLVNTIWVGKFAHQVNISPVTGNKIVEHHKADTITAFFKNPDISLDTVTSVLPSVVVKQIKITAVTYFDRNADGFIDSLFFSATMNSIEKNDLDVIIDKTTLPSLRLFEIVGSSLQNNGFGLIVNEKRGGTPETFVNTTEKVITETASFPGGGEINGGEFSPIDSVAPVIVAAEHISSTGSGNDSLKVQFSENCNRLTNVNSILFKKRDGEQYVVNININGSWQNKNYTGAIESVQSGMKIDQGDSVWINPASKVMDKMSVIQDNAANRKVIISKIKNISFSKAVYFDRNADGYIDSVTISLSGSAVEKEDLEEIKSSIKLPVFRMFTIDSIAIENRMIVLNVKENRDGNPVTNVNSDEKIEITGSALATGGFIVAGSIIPEDKVAPVIVSSEIKYSALNGIDSISILFSESVLSVSTNEIFLFETKDSKVVKTELDKSGTLKIDTYLTILKSTENGYTFQSGDRIWINVINRIEDNNGTIQTNSLNRHAPITVQAPPFSLVPKVVNNPYNPNDNFFVIPPKITDIYRQNGMTPPVRGMIIIVEPNRELEKNVVLSATLSIYDVVKNSIVENAKMAFDVNSKRLVLMWDGRNRNGRLVSTGTYQAIVKITGTDGYNEVKTIRLGVVYKK